MHTPGPWTTTGDTYPIGVLASHRFGADDPEVVCQIGGDIKTPEDSNECEANARLIAAAPEMVALVAQTAELDTSLPTDDEGLRRWTSQIITTATAARALLARIAWK